MKLDEGKCAGYLELLRGGGPEGIKFVLTSTEVDAGRL